MNEYDRNDEDRRLPRISRPAGNAERDENDAIEPELVSDEEYAGRKSGTGDSGGVHFYSFSSLPGAGTAFSCLPSFITVFIAFFMAVRYGMLEAFCFLIFAAAGKGISFFISLRRLFFGRPVDPMLLNIAVWLVSWALVMLLRG